MVYTSAVQHQHRSTGPALDMVDHDVAERRLHPSSLGMPGRTGRGWPPGAVKLDSPRAPKMGSPTPDLGNRY